MTCLPRLRQLGKNSLQALHCTSLLDTMWSCRVWILYSVTTFLHTGQNIVGLGFRFFVGVGATEDERAAVDIDSACDDDDDEMDVDIVDDGVGVNVSGTCDDDDVCVDSVSDCDAWWSYCDTSSCTVGSAAFVLLLFPVLHSPVPACAVGMVGSSLLLYSISCKNLLF